MRYFEPSKGSLYFTFMGVPTVIRPSSWIVLLLLGSGGFSASVNLQNMLIFVAAGMLCLLMHEYGHAFSCRALGGGQPKVEIASLGGVTSYTSPPPTRARNVIVLLAGPGASILMGVLAAVLLALHVGVSIPKCIVFAMTLPLPFDMPDELVRLCYLPAAEAIMQSGMSNFASQCYHVTFFVSVWWSLFNLLPIFPLDGGQTLYQLTGNHRLTGIVGTVVAALLAYWSLCEGMIYTLLLCGWFVWINLKIAKTTD